MIKFFKQVLERLFVQFFSFLLLGIILLAGLALVSQMMHWRKWIHRKEGALVIDLSRPITESPQEMAFPRLIRDLVYPEGKESASLLEVLHALDCARQDPGVSCILLTGTLSEASPSLHFASLEEVRAKLLSLKEAGKPIFAYVEEDNSRDYFLKSTAQSVWAHPNGFLKLSGMALEEIFLGEAFQRYGLGAQVVRKGNYKSLSESLVLKEMSPENRLQRKTFMEDVHRVFTTAIETQRNLADQTLVRIQEENLGLLNSRSLEYGLVDEILHYDQFLARMEEKAGPDVKEKTFQQISLHQYLKKYPLEEAFSPAHKSRLAVVYIDGAIYSNALGMDQVSGRAVARKLRKLRKDPQVKAVVVRVNSPGGLILPSVLMAREVELMRETKPIVVSMGPVAASGGYYLAAGASAIFAQSSTLTGSIGVIYTHLHVDELARRHGIYWDRVQTSSHADAGTAARPLSQEELRLADQAIQEQYNAFLETVSRGRGLTVEAVDLIAQGRIWSGLQAQKIGLVDQLGGLQQAIDYAAHLAQLKTYHLEEHASKAPNNSMLWDFFHSLQTLVHTLNIPGVRSVLEMLQTKWSRWSLQTKENPLFYHPIEEGTIP